MARWSGCSSPTTWRRSPPRRLRRHSCRPGGVTWLTILADPELPARHRNRFLLSHQGRSGSAEETRMDIEDTDIVVIGMGPGGEDADETARTVATDERMRVAEGLWAIGDVTGKGAL